MKAIVLGLLMIMGGASVAQDSLILKIHHAEPINVDLIRDLGARKGEKEINVGWGVNSAKGYITHAGFVEYEFAPINRLGLEVEVPFHFYQSTNTSDSRNTLPGNRVDGLKLAAQYTFLVSDKAKLSMAAGYIHEFEFHPFAEVKKKHNLFEGMLYNPIVIIAKKWGANVHTLLYTGPVLEHASGGGVTAAYDINFSAHYMLPGSSNFIGIESNIEYSNGNLSVAFHPQTKLKLANGLALGLATGIPVNFQESGISFMARVVYEPGRRK